MTQQKIFHPVNYLFVANGQINEEAVRKIYPMMQTDDEPTLEQLTAFAYAWVTSIRLPKAFIVGNIQHLPVEALVEGPNRLSFGKIFEGEITADFLRSLALAIHEQHPNRQVMEDITRAFLHPTNPDHRDELFTFYEYLCSKDLISSFIPPVGTEMEDDDGPFTITQEDIDGTVESSQRQFLSILNAVFEMMQIAKPVLTESFNEKLEPEAVVYVQLILRFGEPQDDYLVDLINARLITSEHLVKALAHINSKLDDYSDDEKHRVKAYLLQALQQEI